MWLIALGILVAIGLFVVLYKPKHVSAPVGRSVFKPEENRDHSEIAVAIKQSAKDTDLKGQLFSNIRLKGWAKHSALIHYLFVSDRGIIIIRNVSIPAKRVYLSNGQWFVETENGNKKIKDPVDMCKYASNVLRYILKKKCSSFYDKLKFVEVVLFNDDVEIAVPKKEKADVIVIKRNKIPDLIEMIANSPASLRDEELNELRNAVESSAVA